MRRSLHRRRTSAARCSTKVCPHCMRIQALVGERWKRRKTLDAAALNVGQGRQGA